MTRKVGDAIPVWHDFRNAKRVRRDDVNCVLDVCVCESGKQVPECRGRLL